MGPPSTPGDNMHTARSVAMACGIIEPDNDNEKSQNRSVVEKSEFRAQGNWSSVWPSIRVLARAQLADKYNLVKAIVDSNREVVAVVGDGTNDALALRKADVGFSMVGDTVFTVFFIKKTNLVYRVLLARMWPKKHRI